ncbi:patatin-like phospholipase family protein [Anaeromassilibacillus sp. An200]|uniref:patatin-like phospholipase family protein n=1 Tax=Anaeromassilibacillus sp. An200 TaxID=1965587 RepID=UPI000B370EC2|nr:patatin family protein [Anaeromassilibacillus sp. An200]OUP13259.1 patatin family protein [Anaeromassilibacillus sp. An200]
MKTGLVLEGGGLRGVFTAGVLDAFLDGNFHADYVIGVSAGAANGVSYVSGQRERGLRTNTDYLHDPRYMGLRSLLLHRSLFGMDFIFHEIPQHLDPFDYQAFQENLCEFWTGAIDIRTGETVYFGKEEIGDDLEALRATTSLPLLSQPVAYRGRLLLDGGTADPIPVRRALADGCDRVVVVLTRERGYRKPAQSFRAVYRSAFRRYPAMIRALDTRHRIYNDTLDFLAGLECGGTAAVIAPATPPQVRRIERDRDKLLALYQEGLEAGRALLGSGFLRNY